MAPHVRNPDRVELNWYASYENPASLGGIPVKVGVTFSGSVMTVLGAESGPAYSGPITIKVRVTIEGIEIPSSSCVDGHTFSGGSFRIPDDRESCIRFVRGQKVGCGIVIFANSLECLGDPSISEARDECRDHFDAELPKCG